MASDEWKTVEQIEVEGYFLGGTWGVRCELVDKIQYLKKHGLAAIGATYGPIICLSNDKTSTDLGNYYHLERLPGEAKFTADSKEKISNSIRSSLKLCTSEQLSADITSVVVPFITPTAYDRLRAALLSWFSELKDGDEAILREGLIALAGSKVKLKCWGKWRLTKCRDSRPAYVEYETNPETDRAHWSPATGYLEQRRNVRGEIICYTYCTESPEERQRLAAAGIHFPHQLQ